MNAIAPMQKVWNIGDVEYIQRPLGLDRTTQLMGKVGELFAQISSDAEVEKAFETDTSSLAGMMGLAGWLLRKAPNTVIDLAAIVLDLTAEKDIQNIKVSCTPRQFLSIAIEFFKQNDVKGLREDFLELQKLWESSSPTSPSVESKKSDSTI